MRIAFSPHELAFYSCMSDCSRCSRGEQVLELLQPVLRAVAVDHIKLPSSCPRSHAIFIGYYQRHQGARLAPHFLKITIGA